MRFFTIEPEVAGGWGENVVVDTSTHPPRVDKLHYEIDDWFGDCLVTAFPCLVATEAAASALRDMGATGIEFADVEISTSLVYAQLYENKNPERELPKFVWLRVVGAAGEADVGTYYKRVENTAVFRFVISERALEVLRPLGLNNAEIEPFQ